MALRLRVTPDRASYRPGDVLAAVVEASSINMMYNKMEGMAASSSSTGLACMLQAVTEPVTGAVQAATTHLEALQIELCAAERVDLNWVTAKYRAGSSITERDNRRVTRPVLKMKPVRLCEQTTLLPGSRRLYLVRSVCICCKSGYPACVSSFSSLCIVSGTRPATHELLLPGYNCQKCYLHHSKAQQCATAISWKPKQPLPCSHGKGERLPAQLTLPSSNRNLPLRVPTVLHSVLYKP